MQVFDDLLVFEDPVLQKPAAKPEVARARVAENKVAENKVAEDKVARDLDFFDDLEQAQVVEQARVVDKPVEIRVEALVPYVFPKIIPGEPEPVPDELPSEKTPDEKTPGEKARLKINGLKLWARTAFKPKVLRVTKKMAHSLQPVVVPRHRPRVRRVTRVVRHVDTWSVFKIALLFNIFLYAVCLTAGAMLWRVAENTGTIENVERFFESFGWQTFELKGGEIYHNAWIAGLFGVVGLTGLAVLAATMFNLITDLVGGVRVTVLEEEVVAHEQRVVTWPRLLRPPPPSRDEPPID